MIRFRCFCMRIFLLIVWIQRSTCKKRDSWYQKLVTKAGRFCATITLLHCVRFFFMTLEMFQCVPCPSTQHIHAEYKNENEIKQPKHFRFSMNANSASFLSSENTNDHKIFITWRLVLGIVCGFFLSNW